MCRWSLALVGLVSVCCQADCLGRADQITAYLAARQSAGAVDWFLVEPRASASAVEVRLRKKVILAARHPATQLFFDTGSALAANHCRADKDGTDFVSAVGSTQEAPVYQITRLFWCECPSP